MSPLPKNPLIHSQPYQKCSTRGSEQLSYEKRGKAKLRSEGLHVQITFLPRTRAIALTLRDFAQLLPAFFYPLLITPQYLQRLGLRPRDMILLPAARSPAPFMLHQQIRRADLALFDGCPGV